MKAVLCRQYGEPELLQVEDVPTPDPGPGQVLIEVQAAGVSYVDTLIIKNLDAVITLFNNINFIVGINGDIPNIRKLTHINMRKG